MVTLEKNEYIDLVIVATGKDFLAEQVKMTLRADGIDKIKSPEYRMWPQLWPVVLADIITATLSWFLIPSKITFIPHIPQNVFVTGLLLLFIPLFVIVVLVKRIKWEKE